MGHQPAAALIPTVTDLADWHQVNLRFTDNATGEPAAVAHLSELVEHVPGDWFFIRKAPWWRLRFHARPDQASTRYHRLHRMAGDGVLTEWVVLTYEPETRAFGGARAMRTAHELFARDSRHVLAYLTDRHARPEPADQRDQVSLLLCTLMLRSAGQDWYEQGDVWDQVAKHRALQPGQPAPMRDEVAQVRRRLQLDTVRVLDEGHMSWLRPWADAYAQAGTSIGVHNAGGLLERGVRAVLAHHVLFAWNRIGLSPTDQAHLAHAAAAAVFDD